MKRNPLAFFSTLLLSLLALSCTNSQDAGQYFESEAYERYENADESFYAHDIPQQNPYEKYKHVEMPDQPYGERFKNQVSSRAMGDYQPISNNQNGLTMQPLVDPQSGMPSGHVPLPTSWSIRRDGWHGPNGIKVEFLINPIQSTQQVPYQSPEQFLSSQLAPIIQKEGGIIQRTYSLPAIAKNDQNYIEMLLLNPGQQKTTASVLGIDVYKPNESGVIIVKCSQTTNPYNSTWLQTMIVLTAKDSDLKQAKQTLIHALSNFQPHMPHVRYFMQREQQKANQSWTNHNSRMRNNQRNFEARNQANQRANAAVNDAITSTYRSQSQSFDRTNQSLQNGIYNENTVTNPYDGTSHQSDAMYDRTYMNAFGEQIQTNDQFYQPESGYQEVYPTGGSY